MKALKFENKNVRVVKRNGKQWFVGRDVSDAMGYNKSFDAYRLVSPCNKHQIQYKDTNNTSYKLILINAEAITEIAEKSNLPKSRTFKRWLNRNDSQAQEIKTKPIKQEEPKPMTKEMQVFKFENKNDVRIINRDGNPWFVAKDVAEVLGYDLTGNMLKRLDDDEKTNIPFRNSGSNYQTNIAIINESGLYNAILGSKKPEAKAFKKWVTSEVLPSIRKHGGYIKGQEEMVPEELLGKALLYLKSKFDEQEKQLATATAKLEQDLTVDAFRALHIGAYWSHGKKILLGKRATKLCCEQGIPIGTQTRTIETSAGDVKVTINTYPKTVLDQVFATIM